MERRPPQKIMLITDSNGESVFVNTLELNVAEILQVSRDPNDEYSTIIKYKGNKPDVTYDLDEDGHTEMCSAIQTRYEELLAAGFLIDPAAPPPQVESKANNLRSIKVE